MKPTKKGFGCPIVKPSKPILTQRRWRVVGGLSLAGSALLAVFGPETLRNQWPLPALLAYWGCFAALMLAALFAALLDLYYIRMQYRIGQREIFRATIGSEEFRRALRGLRQKDDAPKDETNSQG